MVKSNNIVDHHKKGPYFDEAVDLLEDISKGKRMLAQLEKYKEEQKRHEKEMLRLLQRSRK